jgi:site-specific DNA recombinase
LSEESLTQSPSTNGHGPKRAVLYARVSTDEQAKSGFSLDDQLRELHGWAKREGVRVVTEVLDDGHSGSSPDRPGLHRIMELAERDEIDAVVATKRDRWFRSRLHRLLFDQDMADLGVEVISLNDTNNIIGDSVLDSFAEYERQQITERTQRGKRESARKGRIVASSAAPRFGFRYSEDKTAYLVDEPRMAIVHEIFRAIAGGQTLYGVVEDLNGRGIPSPRGRRWTTAVIREMIWSDAYKPHSVDELAVFVEEGALAPEVFDRLNSDGEYGIWRYADVVVPIVSAGIRRETVERARESIRHNKRASNAGKRFWSLSGGILRCALCGSPMEPSTTRPKGKAYFYYRCSRTHRGWPRCENRTLLRAEYIEENTWAFVSDLFRDPDRLRMEFDKMIERDKAGLKDANKKARSLARHIADLDDQKSRAQDLAIRGLLEPDELAAKLEELGRERAVAQRELASAQNSAEHIQELERFRDEAFAHFALLAIKRMADLSPQDQHETYKYLDLRLEVNDEHEVRISGALYPDGSYFDPTGSVCGVETGSSTASVPIEDP